MNSSARRSRGFTLIEVLVVLATILVVLTILSPAIEKARDRVRTVKCRNNLKQIALALHNYHDAYASLPPGYVVGTKVSEKDESRDLAWNLGWGWQAAILPYCDQAPLFGRINYNLGLPTQPDKVATAKIEAYRCPEDSGSALVAKVKVLGPVQENRKTTVVDDGFGRSNYIGNAGWDNDWHGGAKTATKKKKKADDKQSNWSKLELGHDFQDEIAVYAGGLKLEGKKPCPNARDGRGAFGENSHRKFHQLVDGMAHTFLAGERTTPTKNGAETDVGNVIWAGVADRSTRVGQSLSLGSAYWPINQELTTESVPNTTGFNSRHEGGANLMFADGVVRTVSQKIDLALLRRLSIIDDGMGEFEIPIAP